MCLIVCVSVCLSVWLNCGDCVVSLSYYLVETNFGGMRPNSIFCLANMQLYLKKRPRLCLFPAVCKDILKKTKKKKLK